MCLSPLCIKTKDAFGLDVMQSVPCGECVECLKDRQNSWKIRLTEESRDHKYVYFFTLTYNDDSVPFTFDDDGNKVLYFDKSHLQLWLKRNRISFERLFKRSIDFKYFICSEYGPNTGRPHYHGILFTDVSPAFISSMFADWRDRFGFTNFSEVGKNGKKKHVVIFLLSEIMFRNTVLKSRLCFLRRNFVLTDLSSPELFRIPLELCLKESVYLMLKE